MFFHFPVHVTTSIRSLALLLNTVMLIVMLITVELVYSERPAEDRKHLRHFFPLLLILIGLLIYAGYLQGTQK